MSQGRVRDTWVNPCNVLALDPGGFTTWYGAVPRTQHRYRRRALPGSALDCSLPNSSRRNAGQWSQRDTAPLYTELFFSLVQLLNVPPSLGPTVASPLDSVAARSDIARASMRKNLRGRPVVRKLMQRAAKLETPFSTLLSVVPPELCAATYKPRNRTRRRGFAAATGRPGG